MTEFLGPDFNQWEKKYKDLPNIGRRTPKDEFDSLGVFNRLEGMFDRPLQQPYLKDIIQNPEKAAQALTILYRFRDKSELIRGGIAYAIWMADSRDTRVSYLGLELCGGFVKLQSEFHIPKTITRRVRKVLDEHGYADYPYNASGLFKEWMEETQGQKPMVDWYDEKIITASEQTPID